MSRLIKWFLAYFRLSSTAVCEISRGNKDYHDYHDDRHKQPWHFVELECERCGKKFYI